MCLVWSHPEQPFLCAENSPEKHIRFVTEGQMAQTVPMVLQQQLKLKDLAEDKKCYDELPLATDEENSPLSQKGVHGVWYTHRKPTFFHCYPCTHKGYLQTEVQLCPAARMSPKQSMPADVRGSQHCYHTCFSSFDSFSLLIFSQLLLSPRSSSGRLFPCPSSAGTGEISFESMAIRMKGWILHLMS